MRVTSEAQDEALRQSIEAVGQLAATGKESHATQDGRNREAHDEAD